jgi:hypothetical protein
MPLIKEYKCPTCGDVVLSVDEDEHPSEPELEYHQQRHNQEHEDLEQMFNDL